MHEVQDYLLYLSQKRHLAWKSCNTIRHGVRFFYRVTLDRPATEFYIPCAKAPSKLPQILSHEEIVRLFTVTPNRNGDPWRSLAACVQDGTLAPQLANPCVQILKPRDINLQSCDLIANRKPPHAVVLWGRCASPADRN